MKVEDVVCDSALQYSVALVLPHNPGGDCSVAKRMRGSTRELEEVGSRLIAEKRRVNYRHLMRCTCGVSMITEDDRCNDDDGPVMSNEDQGVSSLVARPWLLALPNQLRGSPRSFRALVTPSLHLGGCVSLCDPARDRWWNPSRHHTSPPCCRT